MKIKSGLSGLNAPETVVRSRYALLKLEGNPNFTNPPYPISEVSADVDLLDHLDLQVTAGHKLQIPQRNQVKKTVHFKMGILANYVNAEAKGDLDKLVSSGFELQKERTPASLPSAIEKLKGTKAPGSGNCRFVWSGSKGRAYYLVQQTYTPQIESSWKEIEHTTKTHCVVNNLQVGSFTYLRVCACNTAGQGEWSDVAKVMVA